MIRRNRLEKTKWHSQWKKERTQPLPAVWINFKDSLLSLLIFAQLPSLWWELRLQGMGPYGNLDHVIKQPWDLGCFYVQTIQMNTHIMLYIYIHTWNYISIYIYIYILCIYQSTFQSINLSIYLSFEDIDIEWYRYIYILVPPLWMLKAPFSWGWMHHIRLCTS